MLSRYYSGYKPWSILVLHDNFAGNENTIFEVERIACYICLFDLLAGPIDKHFIVHVGLNCQTYKKSI